jgi:hypothetical protein
MTGRYRITFAPVGYDRVGERLTRKRWSIFVHTCESLAADGLDYAVTFALTGDDPHILITASGTVRRKHRLTVMRHGTVQPVKSQECALRALEAEWFLPEKATKRNTNTTHWQRRAARYAELSPMAEEQLRAEVEFWRELELLSGQRQHFKPGLTDDTAWADDEVAA